MVTSFQYPYVLQVLNSTGGGQDANGDFVPTVDVWEDFGACREESSKGFIAKGVDGEKFIVSSVIYYQGLKIESGKTVRVLDVEGDIRTSGVVLGVREGFYNTQLWV